MKPGRSKLDDQTELSRTIAQTMDYCHAHPWNLIDSELVYTLDSTDLKNPVKLFPKLEYIKYLSDEWMNHRLMAIHKCRRMMISWTMIVVHLWLAMLHPGAQVFFISDKADKSNELVRKAEFIYDHIPPNKFLKPAAHGSYCKLVFPGLDSYIMGLPSGSNQLRQYTSTAVFFDEYAFWETGQSEALASARPTTEGGGKLTIVSSVHDGPFYDLIFDRLM
jgi:hypothetical protein